MKLAVQSVIAQDFSDFEIVISDNASSEAYDTYVDSLKDRRVTYLRSHTALSVTENWNRSLRAATGDYVLMLGDDDALAPGLLKFLSGLIAEHDQPTVLYMMAYHYIYPEVAPWAPCGSLSVVANSDLFLRHPQPYSIRSDEGSALARQAVNFQQMVSFNAQHFVWRRDFTQSNHDFFQPPYPDYFAAFYTFAKANHIIVVPSPCIIIGIAKQSFGFFFINNRQDEGNLAFGDGRSGSAPAKDEDVASALAFPGPVHYRNWLLTSLRYQTEIDSSVVIETDRYRRIQIVETLAEQLAKDPTIARPSYEEWSFFEDFVSECWDLLQAAAHDPAHGRSGSIDEQRTQILRGIGVYCAAQITDIPLNDHSNIMDAFEYLASTRKIGSKTVSKSSIDPKPTLWTTLKALAKVLRPKF